MRCRHEAGDIIARVDTPKDYEHLLLCDGSAFDKKYIKLADIFTDGKLPNLIDKFLEGSSTAKTYKEAGLPDIQGYFNVNNGSLYQGKGYGDGYSGPFAAGAISNPVSGGTTNIGSQMTGLWFVASKANATYGKSNTVQPASYTVKYYICWG